MASAHDVAAYVVGKCGVLTAMKLQKLLYYSQAWSLVWDDKPLFRERIEAWANGPVLPEIYRYHRGQFQVTRWTRGDSSRLSQEQIDTVDSVLQFYGDKSSLWLSQLTHEEAPWKDAREGLAPGQRGSQQISLGAMAEYYGSLV